MRYSLLAIILAAVTCAAGADKTEINGTWSYSGLDAAFDVRLDGNGDCFISAASASTGGVGSKCHYTLEWPNVSVYVKHGDRLEKFRLVLVGEGALMRFEGEAKRPLRRVWDAPSQLPPAIDLNRPGALSELEEHDPSGYRTVVELVDFVQRHGCRGAFLAEIKKLVRWDFISCASSDDPPETSHVGFWLGDNRYFIDIQPR